MIYTLTVNPSLDYIMEVEHLSQGAMNRCENTQILPGGKGINVSIVLTNLGIENVAILPVAGFTGEKLLKLLSTMQIVYDKVQIVKGDTRLNVKVLGKEETQLNAKGADLTKEEQEALLAKLDNLTAEDCLILSGSVPPSLGTCFYADIMKKIKGSGVKVVLDTVGEGFLNALPYEPFLVKPNQEELEDMFQTKVNSQAELLQLAEKVQKLGAKNVLVSLGSDGAVFLGEKGQVLVQKAPKGESVNTIGAGDSMVAGFVAGYMQSGDFEKALKLGIAAGSASAFSKNLATKEEIDALRKNL